MSRTIYCGNLPGGIREREVEDVFYKYGKIVMMDIKHPPRPPSFAFIEFEKSRDAQDACKRDGYELDGFKLRVEVAHGAARGGAGGAGGGGGGGGGRGGVSRRTEYRVTVTGLPRTASWQDLKDHMRRAGDVTFTNVVRERGELVGEVDFATADEMRYAVRKLDDTEFRNPFDKCYIRVQEDRRGGRDADRSHRDHHRDSRRSRRSHSRDRRRSPSSSRSASRSTSPPAKKGKRSPAKSPPSPPAALVDK